MKTIINESLKRCSEINLSPNSKEPLISFKNDELEYIRNNNIELIEAFNKSCHTFISKLKDDVVIMLTDSQGILLSSIGSKKNLSRIESLGVNEGISFLEESMGTNAISIAVDNKKSVFLKPEEHYLIMLKNWHCFATPLIFDNKIIGYLDVSTINLSMKNEIKIIAELLPYKIILEMYDSKKINEITKISSKIRVSNRQKEIMNMLILGLTEKQIAKKLFISIPTVKYHKSKIFEKLNVSNTNQFTKKYCEIENLIYS